MVNPSTFIKEKLDNLVVLFADVICKYEYQDLSDAHYVEINPSGIFHSEDLKLALSDILIEFITLFPEESLVFLTETDGIQLGYPEFVVKGNCYVPTWAFALSEIEDEVFIEPISMDADFYLAA